MIKVVGISFSYADNSLQTRGLQLLDELNVFDKVCDMTDFDMPICNSNKSDGNVPQSVNKFVDVLNNADVLVFAVSEATGHYSAGFKNAMDWLVVKSKFNAKLGTNYAITNKPIFVVTFTPTKYEPNGARHFDMTTQLLEKLGANVVKSHVINDSWETVIPKHTAATQALHNDLTSFLSSYTPHSTHILETDDNSGLKWLNAYNDWDNKWKA